MIAASDSSLGVMANHPITTVELDRFGALVIMSFLAFLCTLVIDSSNVSGSLKGLAEPLDVFHWATRVQIADSCIILKIDGQVAFNSMYRKKGGKTC